MSAYGSLPMLSALVARQVAPRLGRRPLPGLVAGVVLVRWLWVALPIVELRAGQVLSWAAGRVSGTSGEACGSMDS